MATLVSSCEIPLDRKASLTAVDDSGTEETNTRAFRFIYDDTVTDIRQVLYEASLPPIGSVHPSNAFIQCKKRTVIPQGEARNHFIVTADYEVPPLNGFDENPLALPWVVGTDVRESEVIIEQDFSDFNGRSLAVQNSAQDWFDPPLMDTEYWHVINMTINVATWSLANEYAIENTINNANFPMLGFNFPKHSLWCTRYTTGGKQTQNGVEFYPLNVQFVYKKTYTVPKALIHDPAGTGAPSVNDQIDNDVVIGGWDRALVDQGYNHRPGSFPGTLKGIKPILDCSQKQTKTPQKLNGFGVREGQPCDDNNQYEPVYLIFQSKREFDFSTVTPAFPVAFP